MRVCDCCGTTADLCGPDVRYECSPHVVYDVLCAPCAADMVAGALDEKVTRRIEGNRWIFDDPSVGISARLPLA